MLRVRARVVPHVAPDRGAGGVLDAAAPGSCGRTALTASSRSSWRPSSQLSSPWFLLECGCSALGSVFACPNRWA